MLTTIEAEVDVNGTVTLLEPIKLKKKSRAIVTLLESEDGQHKPLSSRERREAMDELLRFAGAVSSGNPHAGDNDAIDADLAREYGKDL